MTDVLGSIVAATRARLREEPIDERAVRHAALKRVEGRPGSRFSEAIRRNGEPIRIIAEIKSASPSAGLIVEHPDVESIATEYRDGGAAAISIVTERDFFHGSSDWLGRAGGTSGLPVLMKDFVVERAQLYAGVAAGADAVLLLASILDSATISEFLEALGEMGADALVEVHDEQELERAIEAGARIIGVNNRDLRSFAVTLETSERLGTKIPVGVVKVSESGIKGRDEISKLEAAGFDAALVGESLLRSPDRRKALRELGRW